MAAHKHWLLQRLTAIIFTFLLFIIIFSFSKDIYLTASYTTPMVILVLFSSIIALWHSVIGMQVICDDYIHNLRLRNILISSIKFIVYISCTLGLMAIICLMVL